MNIRIDLDNIVNFILVILICSFTIFTPYSWGRYLMLLCILAIWFLDSVKKKMKYNISINKYFLSLIGFIFFTFSSSLWALNPADSISKGKTLLEMFFMTYVLYNCYSSMENATDRIVYAIKWSSYLIVMYSILFYGIDTLKYLVEAEGKLAMENSYANVNTIGMQAAVGILIQIDEILRKRKFSIEIIMCIPAVILLAVTMSRKAFVILILGTSMLLVLRNTGSKKIIYKVLKITLSIAGCIVVIYFLSKTPLFKGVMNRMNGLIASIVGSGKIDNSTRLRNIMVAVGWETFMDNPLLGIGMGNPYILTANYLGKGSYLHNNFIELLAGGGIVGFSIFYSTYIMILLDFWKYRKIKNDNYILSLIILVVFLIMDYGRVSYYSKINYVFFLLYFIEICELKKKRVELWKSRNEKKQDKSLH